MKAKKITLKSRLDDLPKDKQDIIWKQYKGLNFYAFSRSTLEHRAEIG